MLTVILPWPPNELSPNAMKNKPWTQQEDDFLRSEWRNSSHAQIAGRIGRTKNSVRSRCHLLGLVDKSDEWTKDQLSGLIEAYRSASAGVDIRLDELADALGRHKSNVCRKARELGLTDRARKRFVARKVRSPKFASSEERSRAMSERIKKMFAEKGHPRGYLGMRHSEETKARIAEASRRANAKRTDEQKAEFLMKAMQTKVKNGTYANERPHTTWKAGWREVGDVRKYFRSKWEANYARYLQWLKENGQIADWKHEPVTFWFAGVKRGVVSYLPDFWVKENNGSEAYHEVKGWMDDRSKTKIRRMAKYHPDVELIVIDSKAYASLKKSVDRLVPGWEA